jgi:hypothetical protein
MTEIWDEPSETQGPASTEKPSPPRSVRGLRLALLLSYLLLPLFLLAYVITDNSFGYGGTFFTFFLFVLPVMYLISLIYLIVWLRTRRRYRFDGGPWSKAIIILMSGVELMIAVIVAIVMQQVLTYNPGG